MKNTFFQLFAVIMLLAMLAGCAGEPAQSTSAPTSQPTSQPTQEATEGTTLPVHTHSYTQVVTEAGCTEGGFTTYTCECGHSYEDSHTEALGHDYVSKIVDPTTKAGGYTEHTCSRCGDSYRDEETEKLPASMAPPSETGQVLHFFDDAAFIGDSVSMKLQNYHVKYGTFGSATFLTAGSYSVKHAVNDTLFLTYQGQQMRPEDALVACGAKKVFILLGMNDVGAGGVEGTMQNWQILLSRIREKCPDIEIYIQSGTPIYIPGEKTKLNNKNMDLYNEQLKAFAAENGCHYVDIATVMKNPEGGLKESFCSDAYVHLTYAACDAWALVLRDYVGG